MKLWVFAFLMFPFFYFLSGWNRPASAFVVATLYEVGFFGLVFMFKGAFIKENPRNWVFLFFGFGLILAVLVVFEILLA